MIFQLLLTITANTQVLAWHNYMSNCRVQARTTCTMYAFSWYEYWIRRNRM